MRNGQTVGRIGRKVLYERGFDHGNRVVSYGIEPSASLDDFLESLATAQNYAQADADGRPVSLELVATVQHGWPIPHGFTLHFEAIPEEYPPLQETHFGSGIFE